MTVSAAHAERRAAGYRITEEEIAELEAEARLYGIRENRQQMLAEAVKLGRSYASAEEAIEDAKKLADWLGVEIE